MAHGRFFRQRRLTEGFSKLIAPEIRIVTKAVRAARQRDDRASDFAATHFLARAIDECRDAHIARGPIRGTLERRDQQSIVLLIQRISAEIGTLAPSLAT